MQLGYELVKKQLFFRKELIERVYWFISLRWIAVVAGIAGSWTAYLLRPDFPVFWLSGIFLFVFCYNVAFYQVWKRLTSRESEEVRHYTIFAHAQTGLDLLVLYLILCFTGGIYSPLLIFLIFHVMIAGVLLSPASCLTYGIAVLGGTGALMFLQKLLIVPSYPAISKNPFFSFPVTSPEALVLYIIFCTAILLTVFLITSVKLGLRTKVSDLLRVSKELDESNAKLTALYGMVKEMGQCSDFQALLDSATSKATTIMGVKGCSIKLLDEHRKILRFASTYGLSEDYTAKGGIRIEDSPVNRKVVQGSFFSVGNIEEKDYFQYPEDIRKEGISSMVCLPLRVERMILGVFCVYSETSRYFEEKDIKFFSLMSDLTAQAIGNLKSEINKTWFLKKAAHQLRSPFNAVYSMLRLIREGYLGPINEKQEETILRCEKRTALLGELIDDLLELGAKRSETGKRPITPVDSTTIMNSLIALYKPQALQKGLTLTFHSEDDIPKILGDENLLDDLFSNLISNAIKYTPKGGRVQVILAREGPHRVRFEVSDTGIGIAMEDQSRLFSEFFRAENAKHYTEDGTGLGLAIVKEILDRLRGTIAVESEVGQGTRFTVVLPAV